MLTSNCKHCGKPIGLDDTSGWLAEDGATCTEHEGALNHEPLDAVSIGVPRNGRTPDEYNWLARSVEAVFTDTGSGIVHVNVADSGYESNSEHMFGALLTLAAAYASETGLGWVGVIRGLTENIAMNCGYESGDHPDVQFANSWVVDAGLVPAPTPTSEIVGRLEAMRADLADVAFTDADTVSLETLDVAMTNLREAEQAVRELVEWNLTDSDSPMQPTFYVNSDEARRGVEAATEMIDYDMFFPHGWCTTCGARISYDTTFTCDNDPTHTINKENHDG